MMNKQIIAASKAQSSLLELSSSKCNQILTELALAILEKEDMLLQANSLDLSRKDRRDPSYDRLLLNSKRLAAIANDLQVIAALPSPLDSIIEQAQQGDLSLSKITCPLGCIAIIYEARPNVSFDAFALSFKAGSSVILKGGADAQASNEAIVGLIKEVLIENEINPDIVQLLPAQRELVNELVQAVGLVDVVIPRGGAGLIKMVREQAKVPVIETGAGVVHNYIDKDCDFDLAQQVVINAKTRRVSVCNALDALIIHQDFLPKLSQLLAPMTEHQVEIFADPKSYELLQNNYPNLSVALPEHFGQEFLGHSLAIKTVESLEEAINHINEHGSGHSEAIISNNSENISKFNKYVDAAVVYANTSTAFTDGAQFGMGAEIGISTQKLHVRGPIGLNDLVSYKWIVASNGAIRP